MTEFNEENFGVVPPEGRQDDYFSRKGEQPATASNDRMSAVVEQVIETFKTSMPDCTLAEFVDGLLAASLGAAEVHFGPLATAERLIAIARRLTHQAAGTVETPSTPTENAHGLLEAAILGMERTGFQRASAIHLMLSFAMLAAIQHDPKMASEMLYQHADLAVARSGKKN